MVADIRFAGLAAALPRMAGLSTSCNNENHPPIASQKASKRHSFSKTMSIAFIYPQYLWLLLLAPAVLALGVIGRRMMEPRRAIAALAFRMLVLLGLIFAIAGAQIRTKTSTLTTVFVLDASDSLPPEEQARGEAFIQSAVESMPPGDQAAVVVFGQDALVERLASDQRWLSELASVPVTTRTDIAGALQLGLALFPGEGAHRMVLLSDGHENLRYAIQQAEITAAQGVELLFVSLGGPAGEDEAWVTSLQAPTHVREGQDFELSAVIYSNAGQTAELALFADNNLLETRSVNLTAGDNRYQIPVHADAGGLSSDTGFRRFRLELLPERDTRLQNNLAAAFTVVHGPPNILLVEGNPGEGLAFQLALQAAEMQVRVISPEALPTSLAEMAGYEALILVNVPAKDLPSGSPETIEVYVRELGMGLLMVGGKTSFGAGGYLRTPLEDVLPVDMDVQDKQIQSNLALVLAVDKSGSMGRCHCDDPDLYQTYTRSESGQPKVDIAKEAVMRAAEALGNQDFLGVVAFDNSASWVQPLAQLVNPLALESAISSFQAEGQTNLVAGVNAAYQALQGVEARRKHIILMTDGWVHTGDLTSLAAEMQAENITLSVIAAGNGSAEYLEALAIAGGGRYYPATDILNVPDLFLKETITSVGEYLVEEPFYPLPAIPGPALHGLDLGKLPPLMGYNGTTAKKTARLELLTPRGDPLFATWQYGLGRAAAWTSDLKAQWAREWVAWEQFPHFSSQIANWLLPAPSAEGLEADAALEESQLMIRMQAIDRDGRPLDFLLAEATVVDPDLQSVTLPLEQVGPGSYEARHPADHPGVYLIRVGANQDDRSLGQLTLGTAVPYSPEYTTSGVNRFLLAELAGVTGGSELLDPLAAFLHNLPASIAAREIWRPLLFLAALLFPLDVAVRRLRLGRSDLAAARRWLAGRFLRKSRPASVERPPLLERLFRARDRARDRDHTPIPLERVEGSTQPQPISSVAQISIPDPSTRAEAPKQGRADPSGKFTPDESEEILDDKQKGEDTLARLKAAKKRARGKHNGE
jgi:Mg-chelatase subunit ChlD